MQTVGRKGRLSFLTLRADHDAVFDVIYGSPARRIVRRQFGSEKSRISAASPGSASASEIPTFYGCLSGSGRFHRCELEPDRICRSRCIRRLEQIWLSAGGETHRRAQRHCSRQPGNSSRGSCPRWSNGQQIRFEHSPGPIPSMLIYSILSVILVCMTDVSQIEQGDPSAAEQHGFEA